MVDMKPKKVKQTFVSELFDYLEIMIFALCVVFLLFTVSVRLCRVDGESMQTTLEGGQLLLVSDMFYTPQSGDIIVFHQSNNQNPQLNKPLVKRVIATGGQYYKIDYITALDENDMIYCKMNVYVSDDESFDESEKIDESYINFKEASKRGSYSRYSSETGRVPEGKLFVMGDNRYNSNDSRGGVGYVDNECVLGKLIIRLAPFGTVK